MRRITITILATVLFLLKSAAANAATYTYDELNRLKTVTYGAGNVITYNYDAAGNITQSAKSGTAAAPAVTAVTPAQTALGTYQNFTLTGSNLPADMAATIEGTDIAQYGYCTYVSGSGSSITFNCFAQVAGDKKFYFKTSVDVAISGTDSYTVSVVGGYQLSVTLAGTGSGNVTSNPAGIACNSGTCSSEFDTASEVTLTAIPDGLSTFGSWSGCTTSNGTGCAVTMDADKSITAQFNQAPKAKVGDTGYTSFSGAYSAAAASPTSTTILLLEDSLTLGVSSINKPLILMGGYKSDFSRTVSGATILQGTLTIGSSGSVVIDRIAVK